jgi:hypothetical protein
MAEIEKPIPNINEQPTPEEQGVLDIEQVVEDTVETPAGETEVVENEDGSVDIDFDPSQLMQGAAADHNANLANFLEENILGRMGSELYQNYQDYKNSRKDWETAYKQGLDLLGFKYEQRTEPFQGASGATHPVLAEAVTQFQALAYKELLPADGPVRTQILGKPTPEKEQQSKRVKDFMNYQIMDQMKEYEPEFDTMLFHLPLAGSSFKKVYYDEIQARAVSKFVPADELVVPYSANSLDEAEAIVHVLKISENELRKQQVAGFYRDIELQPGDDKETEIEKKERELEGISKTNYEDIFTILEYHVNLDIEGFEDMGVDGLPTGIKLPYIVTLEEGSREILSIKRNWEANDLKKIKFNTLFILDFYQV